MANLHRILIVDDSELNRDLLSDMLCTDYVIEMAENGTRALEIMQQKRTQLSCVLLDISMAGLDGFDVLKEMNKNHWLDSLPVIIISSETAPQFFKKAYALGVSDYINRPFDEEVVRKRVQNTINLYANQKKLAGMVIKQMYESERQSNMMVEILGHIVEFRNKESGAHIQNVYTITRVLLEHLAKRAPQYKLTKDDISIISRASALHDIGKISVPYEVLNKPGKLTPEEFEEIKKHTVVGAQMLEALPRYKDEPLVKVAYQICRWHHERYDGKGYPDGLVGDNIPIAAQVVALADVYDALTSVRCYKKAFTSEQAVQMIMTNECGVFNPILISCFKEIAPILPDTLMNAANEKPNVDLTGLVGNIFPKMVANS